MNSTTELTGTGDSVAALIGRYFDLMYDCDVDRFDTVFLPTANLHGILQGAQVCWPAQTYREVLTTREAPSEAGARRQEEVLLQDRVGERQAMVKVRVRIQDRVFVDHLSMLKTDDGWRIAAKTFHLESEGLA
jgi:hypothetical protein